MTGRKGYGESLDRSIPFLYIVPAVLKRVSRIRLAPSLPKRRVLSGVIQIMPHMDSREKMEWGQVRVASNRSELCVASGVVLTDAFPSKVVSSREMDRNMVPLSSATGTFADAPENKEARETGKFSALAYLWSGGPEQTRVQPEVSQRVLVAFALPNP